MKQQYVNFTPSYNATIHYGTKGGCHVYRWKVYDTANGRMVARGVVIVDKDIETAWREADKAIRCAIATDARTIKLQ